jgi:signal peptidase I
MMGDNRNHSSDSRAFGPVNRSFIVGEALIRYWPPQDWGIIQGHNS